MNKNFIIFEMAVLLVCVGFSGCFVTDTEYSTDLPTVDDIQILFHNITHSGYGEFLYATVNGTAKNIGKHQVSVKIKVKFYDKDNVLLDTSFDYISDVDPGEVFAFSISSFENAYLIDNYKIAVASVI